MSSVPIPDDMSGYADTDDAIGHGWCITQRMTKGCTRVKGECENVDGIVHACVFIQHGWLC